MKHLSLIIILMVVLSLSAVLYAMSEVTDDWTGSCLEECSKSGAAQGNCNTGSIRFIADQYARAVKGEPYWETAGGRHFTNSRECAEYRMNELRAICPAALEVLKKSLR